METTVTLAAAMLTALVVRSAEANYLQGAALLALYLLFAAAYYVSNVDVYYASAPECLRVCVCTGFSALTAVLLGI